MGIMGLQKLRERFLGDFNTSEMILFVGPHIDDDSLRKIAKCRWNCVITTRRDADFRDLFLAKNRSLKEFTTSDRVREMESSRIKMPILRLFDIADNDEKAYTPDFAAFMQAANLLTVLRRLLSDLNRLVVVGLQPSNAADPLWALLSSSLQNVSPSNRGVSFWGINNENGTVDFLEEYAADKGYSVHSESLADILVDLSENDDPLEFGEILPSGDRFYQNGNPCILEADDLLPYGKHAMLLTENRVFAHRPNGRNLCQRWFSRFLQNDAAANGPMWCGYDPDRTFYVKRKCEDSLVALVNKMLSNDERIPNKPIFLEGNPGSSKSITLGALAYRIYCERKNPVIFISRDDVVLHRESEAFNQLGHLLEMVENRSGDARVLIVWDCSSYRPVKDNVDSLFKNLRNLGRRFVLVCSAYQNAFEAQDRTQLHAGVVGSADVPIMEDENGYYLTTTRRLDEKELYRFRTVVKNYSGLDETHIKTVFEEADTPEERDIFLLFYQLISLLRPRLRASLTKEQQKVASYVAEKVDALLKKYKTSRANTAMAQAFRLAGLETDESDKSEDDQRQERALDRFNLCIALFSRFKLDTPASLAFRMLTDGDDAINPFSSDNRELFRTLINETSWLHYGQTEEDGDFVFRFRNSLEANIFLENSNWETEQQIDMICSMLRICGRETQETGFTDQRLLHNLLSLIHLMGPNSQYSPFVNDSQEFCAAQNYLPTLIDTLVELREEYQVPDPNAEIDLYIITFLREYHSLDRREHEALLDEKGSKTPDQWAKIAAETFVSIKEHLQKLREARKRAQDCLDELELRIADMSGTAVVSKDFLVEQRNKVSAERVWCNQRILEAVDMAEKFCDELPTDIAALREHGIPFSEDFAVMEKAIQYNPTNGFYYNALFQSFLRMYDHSSLDEKAKLQHLCTIMKIVEDCNQSNVDRRGSRGNDELTRRIAESISRSEEYTATIDDIHAHEAGKTDIGGNSFFKLYQNLFEESNTAGILFVCRKELESAGVTANGNYALNTTEQMACMKVRDFMLEKRNYERFSDDMAYMELLIRVTFMYDNETILTGQRECQLTRLSTEDWVNLRTLCRQYHILRRGKTDRASYTPRPIFTVLYALSIIMSKKTAAERKLVYDDALDILKTEIPEAAFRYGDRLRTLFLLCESDGTPCRFTGTITNLNDKNGNIVVDEFPRNFNHGIGVRFNRVNWKGFSSPELDDAVRGFEIGIGNTSFAAFSPISSKEKRDRK